MRMKGEAEKRDGGRMHLATQSIMFSCKVQILLGIRLRRFQYLFINRLLNSKGLFISLWNTNQHAGDECVGSESAKESNGNNRW